MKSRFLSLAVLLPVIALLAACDEPVEQPEVRKVTYTDDIAPILAKHCIECHVPGQMGAEESGLLMDSYESVLKGSRFTLASNAIMPSTLPCWSVTGQRRV